MSVNYLLFNPPQGTVYQIKLQTPPHILSSPYLISKKEGVTLPVGIPAVILND